MDRPEAGEPRNKGLLRALAVAVASGMTVAAAARMLGIPRRSAYRWSKAERFLEAVEEIRTAALDRAIGKLSRGATQAAETMVELSAAADTDATRLAAAKGVLATLIDLKEAAQLRAKIEALEEQLGNGRTNGINQGWR